MKYVDYNDKMTNYEKDILNDAILNRIFVLKDKLKEIIDVTIKSESCVVHRFKGYSIMSDAFHNIWFPMIMKTFSEICYLIHDHERINVSVIYDSQIKKCKCKFRCHCDLKFPMCFYRIPHYYPELEFLDSISITNSGLFINGHRYKVKKRAVKEFRLNVN